MAKQDIYTWPEGEDDNIDFNAVHEKKTRTKLLRIWTRNGQNISKH